MRQSCCLSSLLSGSLQATQQHVSLIKSTWHKMAPLKKFLYSHWMTCRWLLVKADPSKLYLDENLYIAIFTRSTKCPCGRMMNRCRNCHWHLLMWNKVSKSNEVPLACWRCLTSIGSSVQRHAFNFLCFLTTMFLSAQAWWTRYHPCIPFSINVSVYPWPWTSHQLTASPIER